MTGKMEGEITDHKENMYRKFNPEIETYSTNLLSDMVIALMTSVLGTFMRRRGLGTKLQKNWTVHIIALAIVIARKDMN